MTESECTSSSHGKDDIKPSYRKSNKPLMEKRRRTRINTCLMQLKALVLQAMKKDNAQYSKLEKADILELTVKHLRQIQRAQIAGSLTTGDAATRYRAGFSECAQEVMRFMGGTAGVPDDVRSRVMGHLTRCMANISEQQQQQQLHQHQLQQLQQQLGLVGLGLQSSAVPTGPHPAFSTTSVPGSLQGLHGFPALAPTPVASAGTAAATGAGARALIPAPSGPSEFSHPNPAHLASLASAPTAFQTPPSVNSSSSSINPMRVTAATAPVQVALVLASPPPPSSSSLQASLPFMSAPNSGQNISLSTSSQIPSTVSVTPTRTVLQISPAKSSDISRECLSESSLPTSPVTSEADSFASSRVDSPDDVRRRVPSPEDLRRRVTSPENDRGTLTSPEDLRKRVRSPKEHRRFTSPEDKRRRVTSPEDVRRRVTSPERFPKTVTPLEESRKRVLSPEDFSTSRPSEEVQRRLSPYDEVKNRLSPYQTSSASSRGSFPSSSSSTPSIMRSPLPRPRASLPNPFLPSSNVVVPMHGDVPGDDKMWRPW